MQTERCALRIVKRAVQVSAFRSHFPLPKVGFPPTEHPLGIRYRTDNAHTSRYRTWDTPADDCRRKPRRRAIALRRPVGHRTLPIPGHAPMTGGPSDVLSAGFVACEPENAIRPKIRALSHSLRNRRQKFPTPTEKTFCKSLRQIPETSGICSGFCIPTIRILRKSGEEPLRRSGPSTRTAGQKYPKR